MNMRKFHWCNHELRAVDKTLIGGGGIFIYSSSAQLTSFEINFISKEISRAEPEYMNIHPPISALATALHELSLVPRRSIAFIEISGN